MDILQIKGLTVSIKGRKVLEDISLSLEKGKVTALVGESGSGKTMTALALMTLLPRTARVEHGQIFLNGIDVLSLSGEEKRRLRGGVISMVFQEPFLSLNPVMRVGAQVEEAFIAHRGIPVRERRKRVLDLFAKLKLPPEIFLSYPHEISGGMRQRVLLASAIACRPEILILDEPTTALDVSIQGEILKVIMDIQKSRDLTVLFISHDFSVVNFIADKVAVMRAGRIVESGDKRKVIDAPDNWYTKQLIDCIPRLGDKRKRLPEYRTSG